MSSTIAKTIIGITGHRKISHDVDAVKNVVRKKLAQYNAGAVVIGMALGFDMLVAEVCVEENIPFIAAIPCIGQTKLWPQEEKDRYGILIDKAWKTKIVSSGPYAIWKLFERNKWIVSRSQLILSYWDGQEKGGTYSAIRYAKEKNVPIENLFTAISSK
jgi:predicted Rossmann fold nucleotide-binding protein DprA/Smf involved in DNA uptake